MNMRDWKYLWVIFFLLFTGKLSADENSRSFSAEAVQSAPGMQTSRMKLFVSKNKSVRIEMSTPQGKVVQQYIADKGLMRVLYPERKEYLETKTPTPIVMPGTIVHNPCENLPNAECKKIGEEKVNGQLAIHWSILSFGPNNQQFKIEQWLDKDRGITLREILPNGASINASMIGSENLNGRNAERWEVAMNTADGKTQTGTRWYDVELGITIREFFPNGAVRELKNIVVKEPDESLFKLPKNYHKLDVPIQPQRR